MAESSKPVRVGIEGVSYSLAHVPDLVRYGSKPLREIRVRPGLGRQLAEHLRDFGAASAYAPHQVYIGNLAPEQLGELPKPWYEKLIEGATAKGRFGDLVDQNRFYAQLSASDRFELVMFDESSGSPITLRRILLHAIPGSVLRLRSRRVAPRALWPSMRANAWSALSSRAMRKTRI
jgi:hypothetical protein